jgi:quercetin dioxygenase-like cupin family protein
MMLPHREHIDFGPTPYDQWQSKEGIPIIRGYFVEDLAKVELGPWKRLGALGCYLNLADQQDTDAYVCEIPPAGQTTPQRHLFEEIIYIVRGQGATSLWHEGTPKVTFEWGPGAVFAVPLNASFQHFNGSRDNPVRFIAGTTCPRVLNMFHNEDFIFCNPFEFRDRFQATQEFIQYNDHKGARYWETNLIQDVNGFVLDEFPMKGKGVKHMRFTLADTSYGCHIAEYPPGSRSTFHRHGPGAMIIITQGEGYVALWRDGENRTRYDFRVGSIYSPGDLMWHGHFNTGQGIMRHFAIRGTSPKYSHDRFRNPLYQMIPMDEEPGEINREFAQELARKGIKAEISVVND